VLAAAVAAPAVITAAITAVAILLPLLL